MKTTEMGSTWDWTACVKVDGGGMCVAIMCTTFGLFCVVGRTVEGMLALATWAQYTLQGMNVFKVRGEVMIGGESLMGSRGGV